MKKLYALLVGLLICAAAGAAPATTLYLIGDPVGGWDPLKGTEMTQTSDGIFELDITLTKTQWFGFSQKLGSHSGDWDTMNGSRYGAPENNYQPTLDVPVELKYPNSNSFQLGKGEYHFTVDTNTNKFTVSGQEIEDPTANVLYLRGGGISWDVTEATKFAQDGNTYTLTVAALSGEFKIANSDYSQQFSASSPIELGVPTTVENMGSANSKLAVGSAQNVTLTFVKESKTKGTLTITTESAWEAPAKAYFSANLSGDWEFNKEMTAKGEGVFALEGIEVSADKGYATFTTGELTNWTLSDGLRYGPAGEDLEVVSGESYTATAGSDKAYVLAAGTWDAQITFTQEATTVMFTKTGGDTPGPEVTVPETLYFNGNLTGAEWVFNTPMTKAEASFSYEFEVANENGYVTFATAEMTDWTVAAGGVRYVPAGKADETVESGTASAMVAGNDGAWVLSQGKWTAVATFTPEGASVTFTRTGDIVVPEVTVPEVLYFNGNLSGTEWVFNTPMTKAEATFSYDFEVAGENGYVTFTTAEMTDWTVGEGGVRYVPTGNTDENVESGVATAMIAGNDGAWVLSQGKWSAVATFTAEGASVTFTRTGDIVVPDDPEDEYPVLYLRGADNGWGADESNLMSCSKGIYTITLPSLYGAFKIAAADWADENTATTQNMEMALDVTYTVEHPQGGGSNMAMAEPLKDATIVYDSNNNTLQVTGTVDTECAVTYLLHGQFNLYQAPAEEGIMALEEAAWNDIELAENNGVYSATVVPAAETGSFVVFQKRNGVDYHTLKAAGSEPLTASAGITLSPDSYTDATYSLDPTHKYILALDPTSLQMTATDGGTTGVDSIIVDGTGAEVRYFNLQGVSVANPTPGLYIVVRGGKATKEYIR